MPSISYLDDIERCEKLLSQLVETDTCQPDGNEARLVNFIENRYANTRAVCTRIEHSDNRASLVIKLAGEADAGTIAFIGHIDTVACGDPALWSSPPLSAIVRDGVLYGRGAADMKGGLTSMLLTLDHFIAQDQQLKKSVLFCFTADEEKDGSGARALLDYGLLKSIEAIIVCEPSDEAIGICEKGALWVRVSANGVACHASRPELGVNALEAVIDFASKARGALDFSENNEFLGKNTISVTNLRGGIMTNIVPANASIELDIRTLPTVSHTDIQRKLVDICAELELARKPLSLKLEIINNRPPLGIEETDGFVNNIMLCGEKRGITLKKRGLFFYTDASQLVPALGVPFVILGPGDDRQAHKANEHIELNSVARFARIYTGYIEDYCR